MAQLTIHINVIVHIQVVISLLAQQIVQVVDVEMNQFSQEHP